VVTPEQAGLPRPSLAASGGRLASTPTRRVGLEGVMAGSCAGGDHVLYYYSTQSLLLDDRTARGCDENYCHWADVYGEDARCAPDTCTWHHGPYKNKEKKDPRPAKPPLWAPLKQGSEPPAGLNLNELVERLRTSWKTLGELDDMCWKGDLTQAQLVEMQAERQRFRGLIQRWSQLLRDGK
jgi:hypothetical protein